MRLCRKHQIAAYCYGPHHERTLNALPGRLARAPPEHLPRTLVQNTGPEHWSRTLVQNTWPRTLGPEHLAQNTWPSTSIAHVHRAAHRTELPAKPLSPR